MGIFTAASQLFAVGDQFTASWQNGQIKALIDAFGARTAYTPVLTGFTPGNGVAAGTYSQINKLVWFRASFTMGSTSAAAAAIPTLTLPVTAKSVDVTEDLLGHFTGPAGNYKAGAMLLTTGTVGVHIMGASGLLTACSTTTPFTWGNGHLVGVSGFYEAA